MISFEPAETALLEPIFALYLQRVRWMDETGIRQWNCTGYMEAYPREYYGDMLRQGRLYVLRDGEELLGAAVLLEEDSRWEDSAPAYYVHNLVGSVSARGAGSALLERIEALARERGRARVRLDCAVDNEFLNRFYESRGYRPAGFCEDGPYRGVRREKIIREEENTL